MPKRALVSFFFFTIKFCGLLQVNLLVVCHPHSLKREMWGLLCYGFMPGCVLLSSIESFSDSLLFHNQIMSFCYDTKQKYSVHIIIVERGEIFVL